MDPMSGNSESEIFKGRQDGSASKANLIPILLWPERIITPQGFETQGTMYGKKGE